MAEQGSREIKRYFGQTEEGYLFCHVENRDKEASYSEAIAFVAFDALEMVKPHKGSGFDINVAPNSHKTVLIKQLDPYGFSLSSKTLKRTVELGDRRLMQLTREKGKETKR